MVLPTVSVIIPARNEESVIARCIESLLAADYPRDKLEIIVVADGCTDRTVQIAKTYEPAIRTVLGEPRGCKAAALNAAWREAKGDIIAVYDADSVIEPQTIRQAVRHFSKPNIIGVSGTLKSLNKGSLLTRALALETCFASFLEWFFYKLGANAMFMGKNMFIRRKILEEIGGFDEDSLLEDVELSFRIRRMHRSSYVAFEPRAVTWIEEPPDFKAFISQRYRWARGFFRLPKFSSERVIRDKLVDLLHGLPYYISPFGVVIGSLLAMIYVLNLPLLLVLPLLGLFVFNITLIVWSRIFYREPLRDLLLLPVWFVLTNIFSFILIPKSWLDERLGKAYSWYKTPRA
jgi:cellulose synthase/poly-beta-1,6-N-acetylglucosamine synthase-like glycosyltransferase